MPTLSMPSNCSQMRAMRCSVSLAGATYWLESAGRWWRRSVPVGSAAGDCSLIHLSIRPDRSCVETATGGLALSQKLFPKTSAPSDGNIAWPRPWAAISASLHFLQHIHTLHLRLKLPLTVRGFHLLQADGFAQPGGMDYPVDLAKPLPGLLPRPAHLLFLPHIGSQYQNLRFQLLQLFHLPHPATDRIGLLRA